MQHALLLTSRSIGSLQRAAGLIAIFLCALLITGCGELDRPKVEPFYSETAPPPQQELRWSNGRSPKSLDPARAIAAPESDIVRAIYEGLTDLDSRTMNEIPGVAEKWESSDDLRTWTFHLRKDARWSNGESVTAHDFVRSWKRLASLGEKSGDSYLYQNIIGMLPTESKADRRAEEAEEFSELYDSDLSPEELGLEPNPGPVGTPMIPRAGPVASPSPISHARASKKIGVEAVGDTVLKVSLELPDKDFPKLVANPIFRPVYDGGSAVEHRTARPAITNGAFRIVEKDESGIMMVKAEDYWNSKSVALNRVRFVSAPSAEAALDAYRRGEIDIITNASFEPVALKLLNPYEDFRQTTHSALNFYEFNTARAPFNDRRVREALAIAIDRERLADTDLEGTTKPAKRFFPLGDKNTEALTLDVQKALSLIENAGYPNGSGFPPVRLVINRNNTQQRVARSVARMWKQNLNLETEIIVKEVAELNDVRASGDFDLVRRGVVLPTNDDLVNLELIFGTARKNIEKPVGAIKPESAPAADGEEQFLNQEARDSGKMAGLNPGPQENDLSVITEADAIFELKAIPLYYPISFSLIKPYVTGFEINALDAPSLKEVSVDSNWQPSNARRES